MSDTSKVIFLDVRTPEEIAEKSLPGSTNIDFRSPSFLGDLQKLDKSLSYKVYCRSGNRSGQAVQMMQSLGFQDAENIGTIEDALEY